MPELLLPIFVFYLFYLYFAMKNSKTPAEKPVAKTAASKPKTKAEKPVVNAVDTGTDVKPTTPAPTPKTPKKAKAETAKPAVEAANTPEIPMSDRVGLTAGTVWHYLSENGATSVAKMLKDIQEDEKIIQRSIGWLAQEGKITLDVIDRVETIALT